MEIQFPHLVEYEVKDGVAINDIIASLEANRDIFFELPELINAIVPGLLVQKIDLKVQHISHGSLREMFFAAIFLVFQEDLKEEIPAAVESWLGIPVDDRYDTLLTVSVVLLLYLSVDYVCQKVKKDTENSAVKREMDSVIAELSKILGVSEGHLRSAISRKFMRKPQRLQKLAKATLKFFRPSKKQRNAPIQVSGRRIESDVVSEVPYEYEYDESDDILESLEGVLVEVHAKDIDKDSTGWAGTLNNIHEKRLRMKLMPPISSQKLWEKDRFIADVLLVKKLDKDGIPQPSMFYVTGIRNDQPIPAKPKAQRQTKRAKVKDEVQMPLLPLGTVPKKRR